MLKSNRRPNTNLVIWLLMWKGVLDIAALARPIMEQGMAHRRMVACSLLVSAWICLDGFPYV